MKRMEEERCCRPLRRCQRSSLKEERASWEERDCQSLQGKGREAGGECWPGDARRGERGRKKGGWRRGYASLGALVPTFAGMKGFLVEEPRLQTQMLLHKIQHLFCLYSSLWRICESHSHKSRGERGLAPCVMGEERERKEEGRILGRRGVENES